MPLGLSPVDELKKKVDLLATKLDNTSSVNTDAMAERIEELEDLQLLEKLNSIEMREEIQNIRSEIESLGIIKPQDKVGHSDFENRLNDIETRVQEISILSGPSTTKGAKIDLDALKEEIVEELKGKISEPAVSSPVDIDEIESRVLRKVDDKLRMVRSGEVNVAPIDTHEIEENILAKIKDLVPASGVVASNVDASKIERMLDEKIKSMKPGALTSLFSKTPKLDTSQLKIELRTEIESDLKSGVKAEIKGELLSDLRTMVMQVMEDIPTAGVTKGDLKTKLSQLKTDVIEAVGTEKAIDKKLVPVIRSFENLEARFAKNDSQLTTIFSTLPRELKLIKDDVNIRLESHEKTLDQLRRELKEIRLGGIEGYQYLATKEEVRRAADERVNMLRNEILANKLAGDDEKYEEALNRVMSLDDRFSVFKSEVLPTIERLSEIDVFSNKIRAIEDMIAEINHGKLSQFDPNLLNTLVGAVDSLKQKIESIEKEPSEYVKRSLDAIRMVQDRDRETNERIAQFVHTQTEKMRELNEDISSTVVSRLEDFEKRIPPEDVWIEIESLRSRLAAMEKTQKETSIGMRRSAVARPAIIE